MTNKVEELKKRFRELRSEKAETIEQVDVLNELAWEISLTERPRAIAFTRLAKRLARKLDYERGEAYSIRNVAYCHLLSANLDEALKLSKEALEIFQRLEDREGEATALDNLALAYWRLGNYDKALEYAFRGLDLNSRIQNKRGQGWSYHNLGIIYAEVGDTEQAIEYYKKASEMFDAISYKVGRSRIVSSLGEVYLARGDLKKALEFHMQSLELSEKYNIQIGISTALTSIGTIYQKMGELDKALDFYKRSMKLFERGDYKEAKATTLMNLGKLYGEYGDREKGLELLHEALDIISKTNAKPSAFRIRQALSEMYEAMGEYKKAIEHHKAFHQLEEEVFNEDTNVKLKNLQIQMEVEKVEREAEMRQMEAVHGEKMALLNNLVSGLAHEMNTPLGVINSNAEITELAVKKLLDEFSGKDENGGLLHSIEILKNNNKITAQAGKKISTLINSLKNFAELDRAKLQYADINHGIESTLNLLSWKLSDNITLQKEFGNLPKIKCRPQELNQVFMTLLMNAADAISDQGRIAISTQSNKETIEITISDTGKGIPKEKLPKIFEIGFSQKETVRMHFGLANCYKIIQQHGGEIHVNSEVGKGTEFCIKLPVDGTA